MRIADLTGRRVAVWGWGREGRAAVAAVRTRLPHQPLTLFCSETEAAGAGAPDTDIRIVTRAPDAEVLAGFDLIIKSPGISAYRTEILAARARGTLFTSGTALWFGERPDARVIAVTGTKGKSTVTALVAHLLRALGWRVALAGNIGLPLLELLDPPLTPDWWVVELSSFQTREAAAVEVGVVNNLGEEHLDWHGSRECYAADKLALMAVARRLVVNARQPDLLERSAGHADRRLFGTEVGWELRDGALWRAGRRAFELADSPLPGAHNALNACAALAAVEAAGEDAFAAAAAIASFQPLPHRLQPLGEAGGLVWIDDSIATTPQATLEALASLPGRAVTVLVGGFDRHLDWSGFAAAVRGHPPHAIITMGAAGPRIHALLAETGGAYRLQACDGLDAAVMSARALAPPGGVLLLSPGAPSFDEFHDYAERGRHFAALAGFDPARIGSIQGLGIG
ncbi:MAG: UDP-N-acetylmuramoyl-L-alanine--D-glutamate ligase [Xanthomonadales bacterium]|nr:UDP-N-acetylmuramoyl-L-alanine--D-glutamate ligase [Xanthomonadales bacterium]